MGGELNVNSSLGRGSTFAFDVALLIDRRQRIDKFRPGAVDLSTLPILVVDDFAVNCEILRGQLTQLGADPEFATNAREAVQKIIKANKAGNPFAMMITDYQMPNVDGLQLVQSIRRQSACDDLQIIVLSSIDGGEVRRKFEKAGAETYLTKPARYNELEDAIYTAAARFKMKSLTRIAQQESLENNREMDVVDAVSADQSIVRAS